MGDFFDKGKYFLPQLIASAEAMKNAIAILQPKLLKENNKQDMPTICFATVEGDIHDIGKNLVVLMLQNYGYNVIDLGKDVAPEAVLEAAKREKADIVGLSALMTTTTEAMAETVKLINEQLPYVKTVVGGAVLTEEYAEKIGADHYAPNAVSAVNFVNEVFGK